MAPPITLTPQQFAQHPAARKPGASYQGYLRFVANRRGAALAGASADPLAPTPEPVLRQQTTEAVRAQIDPILKNIMGDTSRAAQGIELATQTSARRLEPFAGAAKERFARAAEATAGVSQALADRLAGKGTEAGQGLREKLAAINAPARLTQEVAGGTEQFATDAANAGFGIDSAALDEIISRGAGAEDFAAALPGIANIAGIRSIGDVKAAGQQSLADVRGKVPGLIANLMDSARSREVQKGIAKLGLQETQVRTAAAAKADAAGAQAAAVAAADKSAQAWARIQQAGERIKLQGSKTSFEEGIKNSKLALDQKQYQLALRKEARLAKAPGKKTGGFTPAQQQNMTAVAFDTATAAFADKGKPVDVLRLLIGKGIPFSIAVKAIQRVAKTDGADNYWKATNGWTK